MYHGGGYSSGEFIGDGWFTTSKADAKYYARQSGGAVTAAYIDIQNPLYAGHIDTTKFKIVPDKKFWKSVKKRQLEPFVEMDGEYVSYIETNGAVLIAKDCGYDGVIDIENGKIVDAVIFKSDQIIIKK